ncbi:hypothetical protein HacjB3_05305 [Halalkalicoccus jeotgali B3]|uniref:Uncharacterized protein n=1 Tax=Halalkalicoccus jeotgali (strain DSM 18796 / CECT 7217 / JCM 14584 / KCTC 4019 / B3) TaxID=795797 RepID=D8J9P0_HALJB|nr:hypothetical protein [Halalkalicoccus jeotgali]ADJ14452.1 hypothetical protein HacjB3_05305 [Halalkalicoccus jeotgali B3]
MPAADQDRPGDVEILVGHLDGLAVGEVDDIVVVGALELRGLGDDHVGVVLTPPWFSNALPATDGRRFECRRWVDC